VLSMNRALAMSDAGKVLIMQPYLKDTPDSATGLLQRGFDLGTYLLLKGQHTYLNLVAGGSPTGAYYYPEDTLNLGPAVTPLASDVSQYLWGGAYRRDFQNGVVLVNPGNSPITVDMGQVYEQVGFSGGGPLSDSSLDGAGRYVGGSLSETPTQVVTLAPGSAAFLMNAPTPPGSAAGGGTSAAGGRAATPGAFDPATATWYLRNEVGSGSPDAGAFPYGAPGWVAVVGDWQGAGHSGIGVVNPATATWYLRNEVSSGSADTGTFAFGLPGWVPVVGDWTGSGHTGIAMFDPGTGTWYLRNEDSAGPPDAGVFRYGAPGWVPVVGDWSGQGRTTVGVVDPATMTWYLRTSNSAGPADVPPFQYGAPGWRPVVGDWDGNGTTTVGAVDPATATWYLRNGNTPGGPSYAPFGYGLGRWASVVGYYGTAAAGVASGFRRRTDALDAVFTGGTL
jgi:hypothetical protein